MEMNVWCQIRNAGFGSGKQVKYRELKRLWRRRHSVAKEVELLELGRAGGVFKTCKRGAGASRQVCRGGGQRGMVAVSRPAAGGEEGGQEGGQMGGEAKGRTEKIVRRARQSALTPIFDEVKRTFENWRMGGQYVDAEDCYTPPVT